MTAKDQTIGIRMDQELVRRIDALGEGPAPWMKGTRSDIVRAALEIGLRALEKRKAEFGSPTLAKRGR